MKLVFVRALLQYFPMEMNEMNLVKWNLFGINFFLRPTYLFFIFITAVVLAVTPKRYYSYANTVILFQSNRFLLYLFLLCARKIYGSFSSTLRFRSHSFFFFFCGLFYFPPAEQYCWVCSACAIQIYVYLCLFIRITNPLWVITE